MGGFKVPIMSRSNHLSWILVAGSGVLIGGLAAKSWTLLVLLCAGLVAWPLVLVNSLLPLYLLVLLVPLRDVQLYSFLGLKEALVGLVVVHGAFHYWRSRARPVLSPIDLWCGVFVIVVILGWLRAVWTYEGAVAESAWATGLSFIYGFGVYLAARIHIHRVNIALVRTLMSLGSVFVAAIALLQNTISRTPFATILLTPNTALLGDRLIGPFENPNYLGAYLAFGLVLTIADLRNNRESWNWRVPGSVLIAMAMWLSLSRGALLAAAGGLLIWYFLNGNVTPKRVILRGSIAIVVATLLPTLFSNQVEARLALNLSGYEQAMAALSSSDDIRREMIAVGFRMFGESPLAGMGYGTFSNISGNFTRTYLFFNSHNQYIGVLAETGVIGAVAFGGLVLVACSRAIHAIRSGGALAGMGAATLTFLLSSFTINSVDNIQLVGHFWVALSVLSGCTASVSTGYSSAGQMKKGGL